MKIRVVIAWASATVCLFLTLFLAWWFIVLSVILGCWHGREQFHDAYNQARLVQMTLPFFALALQTVGGICSGVGAGIHPQQSVIGLAFLAATRNAEKIGIVLLRTDP